MFDAAEKLVGETGFAPARASAHEFLGLACIRSTTHRKIGAAGATCTPTRLGGAAVFKTARSTVPRTAAYGRGGRIRTGTGNHAQRVLGPPCLHSNHAATNWCGQRESHPHGPWPTGSSGRRVYCSATSAEKLDPARRLALRSSRYQRDASLPTLCRRKMVEAEGLAPSQPARATRLRRAAIAALPRFENGGSSGICTRDLLLMRELRCLLRHRAKWWAASVMLRVLPVKSRRLHC